MDEKERSHFLWYWKKKKDREEDEDAKSKTLDLNPPLVMLRVEKNDRYFLPEAGRVQLLLLEEKSPKYISNP